MNTFNKVKNKGFTLVEVIVALALLSIIAVGFLPAFKVMAQSSKMSDNITDASVVATNTMEQLYGITQNSTYAQIRGKITSELGFSEKSSTEPYEYSNTISGFTVKIALDGKTLGDNLAKLNVEVFNNPDDTVSVATEQTIITFIS